MHKYSFTIKFEEIILLDQDLILDLSSCALLLSFQDDNHGHKTTNKEIHIQYLLHHKNLETSSSLCDSVLSYLCGSSKDLYIGGGSFYALSSHQHSTSQHHIGRVGVCDLHSESKRLQSENNSQVYFMHNNLKYTSFPKNRTENNCPFKEHSPPNQLM